MRQRNSIRNALIGLIGQILTMLTSFVCRMVFTRMLSANFLGIEGYFSNILVLLSLSELGIGTAITYFMYKPIAENDTEKLKQLSYLYKLLYACVGTFVLVAGIILTPFIHLLIKEVPEEIQHIQIIFMLYILNLALSYFFSYRRVIIEAHQQMYITSAYSYFLTLGQHIAQIIILLLTRNFILYLIMQVLTTFLINFAIALKSKKMYPYASEKPINKLPKYEIKEIFRNVKAMFMHRIGNAVVNGTDNILIAKFSGLIDTGIYSNYYLIVKSLTNILSVIFNGLTASVGNLSVLSDKKYVREVFEKLNFFDYCLFSFASISYFVVSEPFMKLCFGESYVFPVYVSVIIAFNFYLSGMRQVTLRFRDAMGLFYKDRYKAVAESIINLVVSLILAKYFGLIGVFWGTAISTLTTSAWVEPYILYKYGFEEKCGSYFKEYRIYGLITVCAGGITYGVSMLYQGNLLLKLIYNILICLIIPNMINWLLFRKSTVFIYWKKFAFAKLSGIKHRNIQ